MIDIVNNFCDVPQRCRLSVWEIGLAQRVKDILHFMIPVRHPVRNVDLNIDVRWVGLVTNLSYAENKFSICFCSYY